QRKKSHAGKRGPADWLGIKLEQHAEEIVNNALKAADEGDWRAGAWVFERVRGKPKELVKIGASAVDIKKMTPAHSAELRRRALEMHPELAELVPRSEQPTEGERSERQAWGGGVCSPPRPGGGTS